MANMKISRMPVKKVGRENVVKEAVTQKLSNEEPRLRETIMPNVVPIRIVSNVDVPSRSRVFASLPEFIISKVTA